MSIPFIIRDDDLSYFTDVDDLRRSYEGIWEHYPVTFSAIPWQKGALAGHVPVSHWHTDCAYAIGDNVDLVRFITAEIKAGHADIALHGIHHTYKPRRYSLWPELLSYDGNFRRDVEGGRRYLEELFGIDINVFVPPSNAMTKRIASALIKDGWNIFNLPGVRKNSRSLLSMKHQIARMKRLYSFMRNGFDSTDPLLWAERWELGSQALTPTSDMGLLKRAFLHALNNGHPFVLATHHWQHGSLVPGGDGIRQHDLMREFLDYVSQYDVMPIRARELQL